MPRMTCGTPLTVNWYRYPEPAMTTTEGPSEIGAGATAPAPAVTPAGAVTATDEASPDGTASVGDTAVRCGSSGVDSASSETARNRVWASARSPSGESATATASVIS